MNVKRMTGFCLTGFLTLSVAVAAEAGTTSAAQVQAVRESRPAGPAYVAVVDAMQWRNEPLISNMLLADRDGQLMRETDAMGRSLLHHAAGQGSLRIFRLILGQRPDVNLADRQGRTPLFDAVDKAYIDNARLLVGSGAAANVDDNRGMTPLLIACSKGRPELAEVLLGAGAEVNHAGPGGATPLMYAGERGNQKLARLLLNSGANVNAIDTTGNTALHYAARNGRTGMTGLLQGALNARNSAGQTPLDLAMIAGSQDCIRELLASGAIRGERK